MNASSDSTITVYCEFNNPEDMALLPDNKFFIMSEFGGIRPYQEKDGAGSWTYYVSKVFT